MKEKIKVIVLIVIFGVVMLGAAYASKKMERTLDKVEGIVGFIEENTPANVTTNTTSKVTTSVISSFNSNTTPILYSDIVEEEKTGEVIEVTEDSFDKDVLNSKKRILIEFYADWCEPCKTLAPVLEEVAKENLDIKVVKINVDKNPDLASVFGVNYVPLLVVMENAEEVNHAMGALTKKEVLELVNTENTEIHEH